MPIFHRLVLVYILRTISITENPSLINGGSKNLSGRSLSVISEKAEKSRENFLPRNSKSRMLSSKSSEITSPEEKPLSITVRLISSKEKTRKSKSKTAERVTAKALLKLFVKSPPLINETGNSDY